MSFGLEEETVLAARAAFTAFDRDHDGLIASSELEKPLRAMGFNPREYEANDMIEDVGDEVNFSAFLYIVARASRNNNPLRELTQGFRALDKSGCGKLPAQTIRNVLAETRQAFTEKQINDILERVEVKNGLVDYHNLAKVILTD